MENKSSYYASVIWDSILGNWECMALSNYKENGYTYGEVAQYIHYLDVLLDQCHVGQRNKISIIGKNSAEWCIAYQATVLRNSVIVPILPNFTPSDVQHLINHSDSAALFVGKNHWATLDIDQLPQLKLVICLDDFSLLYAKEKTYEYAFGEFLQNIRKPFAKTDIRPEVISGNDLFAIIYTSGTTGFSRGVMLTHDNVSGNLAFAIKELALAPGKSHILSFLPLAHAYGCTIEFLFPFASGSHIVLFGKMPTPELLIKALMEVKPDLILSVPLIIEKIYKKKIKPILEKKLVKALLLFPPLGNLIYKRIHDKLAESFGGRFYEVIIGGAALSEEVQTVLKRANFPFTVGYGMTECAPLISYADWKDAKVNSCGKCVPQLEIKIDSPQPHKIPGEILVKGQNVMQGYYKNEEATHAVLEKDGWLHTGDIATLDKEGYIFIKGRSKSMILTSNGQNIYPEEIESKLNTFNLVQESLVIDRKEGIVALVYPDMSTVDEKHINEKTLQHVFDGYLHQLNKELPAYMRVSKIEIMSQEFEKTPKRSIKRFLYG
ncbi:MAG: AMP-binding protein [Niabella sp.]